MPTLGLHTISETRQLIRTAQFRIEQTNALLPRLTDNPENNLLRLQWANFVEDRWKTAHDKAINDMFLLKQSSIIGVSEDVMPSEKAYNIILRALNVEPGRVSPGDMSDLIGKIEKAANTRIDETNKPLPGDFDPDIEVFKKADAAVKKGEAAVKVPSVSLPWWGWLLGAAFVGSVGYSFYVTGKKVAMQAKQDERYLRGKVLPKMLPGYGEK